MDGWTERIGCEEGEAMCDVCIEAHWKAVMKEDTEYEERSVWEYEGWYKESDDVVFGDFERGLRQGRIDSWLAEREVMRVGVVAVEFRKRLACWADCCVVCRLEEEKE